MIPKEEQQPRVDRAERDDDERKHDPLPEAPALDGVEFGLGPGREPPRVQRESAGAVEGPALLDEAREGRRAEGGRVLRRVARVLDERRGLQVSLAQLERRMVVQQTFPLHSNDERRALESAWTMNASMALGPAPIAQLHNYLGAEFALYFAFLHLYSAWLWGPAVGGLVLAVFQETEYSSGQSVWQASRMPMGA